MNQVVSDHVKMSKQSRLIDLSPGNIMQIFRFKFLKSARKKRSCSEISCHLTFWTKAVAFQHKNFADWISFPTWGRNRWVCFPGLRKKERKFRHGQVMHLWYLYTLYNWSNEEKLQGEVSAVDGQSFTEVLR